MTWTTIKQTTIRIREAETGNLLAPPEEEEEEDMNGHYRDY
jgi:hypothetical protein